MTRQDDYDHYHDYYNRGWYRNADPTGLVLIFAGVVLVNLFKQYWMVVVPCVVFIIVIPVIIHLIFHKKEMTLGVAILGTILAVGYFTVWFFIAHPGFFEAVLGLKPY